MNIAFSTGAALEFVRRLALAAVTGNEDMHLKNWPLVYPGAGDRPEFAPVYDVLSTIPYIPADALALSISGYLSFKAMDVNVGRPSPIVPAEAAVINGGVRYR